MSALDFTARALALRAVAQIRDGGSVIVNGAVADGVTDDRAKLNAFIAEGGHVHFSRADYRLSGPLVVPSNTRIDMARGARLMPGAGAPLMVQVRGSAPTSWVALTSNLNQGMKAFTHTSSGFSVGQWLEFRSNAPIPGPNTAGGTIACVRKIVKKSGSGPFTYTLNKAAMSGYLVADAATCGVATMVENVTIEGLTINSEDYSALIGFGLYLEYCANVRIINPTIIGSKERAGADIVSPDAIKINHGVFDVEIFGADLRHIGWYGISIVGSAEQVRIYGGKAEDARHAVSVVNSSPYGEPIDVLVDGMVANNSTLSAFDTHDTGRDIVFNNCVSIGAGDCGFQLRTPGARVVGGLARGSAQDGFKIVAGATDCVLRSCRAESNGRIGYNLGEHARMIDCDASDHTGPVSGWCAVQIGKGAELRGGLYRRNSTSVIRITSNDPVTIDGLIAPADAAQTVFITAKTTLGGRYNRVSVKNCLLGGYANNSLFLREQATRPAGDLPPVTSGNRVTDGGAGAEWRGEATLVAGTATVATTAVRRMTATNWTEDAISRIDLRRIAPGGTVGNLYVESVTNGASFVIKSSSATDTSKVQWSVEL